MTVTSGRPKRMKSRAISSSSDVEASEYVPGRSTMRYMLSRKPKKPSALPTVLPGQLPVCCFSPVRALKTVLLPVFGLPAKATTKRSPLACAPRRSSPCPVALGQLAQSDVVFVVGFMVSSLLGRGKRGRFQ